MLRQLLTLLAVFAGLTAAVEPVRALEAGVETVRLADVATPCGVKAPVVPLQLDQGIEAREARPCVRKPVVIPAFTVMLRADRAHE